MLQIYEIPPFAVGRRAGLRKGRIRQSIAHRLVLFWTARKRKFVASSTNDKIAMRVLAWRLVRICLAFLGDKAGERATLRPYTRVYGCEAETGGSKPGAISHSVLGFV